MTKAPKVLLMDTDPRSLRVLEVSLRTAGYDVSTAASIENAWQHTLRHLPSLLITDTQLPAGPTFALVERYRSHPKTKDIPVVVVSTDTRFESKMRAIALGISAFLAKPVLVKDIIDKVRALIHTDGTPAEPQPSNIGLQGTLAHIKLADLLQVIEAGRRSGTIHLVSTRERSGGWISRPQAEARFYFGGGKLLDGQLGDLLGAEALYRAFLWKDADFEVLFSDIDRPDRIGQSTQFLLLEGMRRMDEWTHLVSRFPTPDGPLTIDAQALAAHVSELPTDVQLVVNLCDGKRPPSTLVELCPLPDVDIVPLLHRMLDVGVFTQPKATESTSKAREDDSLSNLYDVPRVLEEASIPSPQSASDILATSGAVLRRTLNDDMRDTDRLPGKALTHSSSNVSGNGVAHASSRISNANTLLTPKLTVRRVSSIGITKASNINISEHTVSIETRSRPLELGRIDSSTDRYHRPSAPRPMGAEPANIPPLFVADSEPIANSRLSKSFWRWMSAFGRPSTSLLTDSNDWLVEDTFEVWIYRQLIRVTPLMSGAAIIALGVTVYSTGMFEHRKLDSMDSLSLNQSTSEVSSYRAPIGTYLSKPETAMKAPDESNPVGQPGASPSAAVTNLSHIIDEHLASTKAPANVPAPTTGTTKAIGEHLSDAESALQLAQWEEAKGHFRSLLRVDNSVAAGHSGLAYLYLVEENTVLARKAAAKALRIDERDARANLVLGAIAQNQGQIPQACVRYRRYLSLGGGRMAHEIRAIVEERCRS